MTAITFVLGRPPGAGSVLPAVFALLGDRRLSVSVDIVGDPTPVPLPSRWAAAVLLVPRGLRLPVLQMLATLPRVAACNPVAATLAARDKRTARGRLRDAGVPLPQAVVADRWETVRTFGRAVVAEGFFTRLGFGIVTLYLPLYALELGMSLTEVGLLVGAKALIVPVVKPLMGAVVDRFGARRGYLAAVILRFLGALFLLGAASPGALLTVRFIQGAASAARDPASMTVLAGQPKARLGRSFSAAIGAKDLGAISAGLVGGTVLALSGGDFSLLWVVVAALAAVPVAAVWRWVPASLGSPQAAGDQLALPVHRPAPDRAATSVLRDRRLRRIAALGLFTGLTAHLFHGLFQVYSAEVAGLSAGTIGAIYSLSIITLLVVGPLAGWAADRFGTGPLAGARGIANAVSSVVFLISPSLGGVVAGRMIDDAGKAAFRPTWGTLVGRATRDAGPRGGRVAAGLDTALSMGEALGPLVAGLLWDTFGITVFLIVRAVLGIGTELILGRRLSAPADDPPRPADIPPDSFPVVVDTGRQVSGSVTHALRAHVPGAVPEEFSRAWSRTGLDDLGSLDDMGPLDVAAVDPYTRRRIALAAAIAADPGVVVLEGPHQRELARVLDAYPGEVMTLDELGGGPQQRDPRLRGDALTQSGR